MRIGSGQGPRIDSSMIVYRVKPVASESQNYARHS